MKLLAEFAKNAKPEEEVQEDVAVGLEAVEIGVSLARRNAL